MPRLNDLLVVLEGLQKVLDEAVKIQKSNATSIWNNSSIKYALIKNCPCSIQKTKVQSEFKFDAIERLALVLHGILKLYSKSSVQEHPKNNLDSVIKIQNEELNKQFQNTFKDIPLNYQMVGKVNRPHKIHDVIDIDIQPPLSTNKEVQKEFGGLKMKPVAKKPNVQQSLGESSRARVVPSSRIGRMVSFGSLAAGLGIGTVAQLARNTFKEITSGTGLDSTLSSTFLNESNAERIVDTLCKVRGAALKIGQLLSIQDESVISPELQKIFERVRQSADFMPKWQVEKVLVSQLGDNWSSLVATFEEKPFAAASIGQVHLATLQDGSAVAMKVQYPGVAKGINSDIDNLVGVLKIWNIFPKGLFIDNVVEVAKKELAWEVDYCREAECAMKFKEFLKPYPEYYVPTVIQSLSSAEVITSELVDGVPLDKCFNADLETRTHIAEMLMQLALREMFVFRCMQTDPNWSNFFYNYDTRQLILLDFGATREYAKSFMDQYIEIIRAASVGDRNTILRMSREMKFLTGYESKIMENAHVDTVMILGEVFGSETSAEFDFGHQSTTRKVTSLVPTILDHRLCPPPEEIYSLHRKLSGLFLLCAKLKVKINCRNMFYEIYDNYKFGEEQAQDQ